MVSRPTGLFDGMLARVLLAPLKVGFALVLLLAGLLLVAWTIDWVFVENFWPGRVEGLRELLAEEMAAGVDLATRQGGSTASVSAPADWLYALVFEKTGLHHMAQRFADAGALSIPDSVVRSAWTAGHEVIDTAMLGAQLLGLRAGTLVRFSPLLALLYAVGTVDGLSQRANRRASFARESANLYHRAKLGVLVVLALGTAAVMVWPNPVAWSPCAVIGGLGLAALSAEHWKYYKKHV